MNESFTIFLFHADFKDVNELVPELLPYLVNARHRSYVRFACFEGSSAHSVNDMLLQKCRMLFFPTCGGKSDQSNQRVIAHLALIPFTLNTAIFTQSPLENDCAHYLMSYFTLAHHWAALQICSSWLHSKQTGSDNAAATSLCLFPVKTVKWGSVECEPVSELAPVKQTCSRFYSQHTCRPGLVFFFAP